MSLLGFIVLFVVVGLIMWAVNRYAPMPAEMKKLLNVAVVIVMVVVTIAFLLSLFNVSTGALTTPHRLF